MKARGLELTATGWDVLGEVEQLLGSFGLL